MSPRTNAPATAPAGSGPPDAASDGRDGDGRDAGSDDVGDARDTGSDDVGDARDTGSDGCDAGEGVGDSDLRRATRLLRLVQLVVGILVSVLTALRLLGLL